MAGMYCLKDLLDLAVREGAQDLALETGKSPILHIGGLPRQLELPSLTNDNMADLLSSIATSDQTDELRRCGDIHFIYRSAHSGRFAVEASAQHENCLVKIRPL